MRTLFVLLFGLVTASLLTSCEMLASVGEFAGLVTSDATEADLRAYADSNLDGVISGAKEWFWYLLAGGTLGGVKAARMAGINIPKLGPKLDKIGLGRTAEQRENDAAIRGLPQPSDA